MNTKDIDYTMDDRFFENLIEALPYEKAPENFSEGIMLQLSAGIKPVTDTPESRRQLLWGYLTLAVAFAGVALMFFARLPFLNFDLAIETDLFRLLFSNSMSVINGISHVSAFLKSGSTALFIFASLGLLLLIERILRKGIHRNQTIIL